MLGKTLSVNYTLAQDYLNTTFGLCVCVGGGLLSVVAIKPGVPEISEYLWIF